MEKNPDKNPLVFISHSRQDIETAKAVANLLRAALNLNPKGIRCTSVDGYRLPIGADTDDQLRREVLSAEAFVGIISVNSISSAYVLFELGARWGAGKPLAPLLAPGAKADILKGPLAGINALNCDSEEQLHQFVADISGVIGKDANAPQSYLSELRLVQGRLAQVLSAEDSEVGTGQLSVNNEHKAIIRVFVRSEQFRLYSDEVAGSVGWNKVRTQHYIDELLAAKYLSAFIGEYAALYCLSAKGRAFAVKNGIA